MESTSTVPESYNIQHGVEEENFSPLPDSIEANVNVVIEDSTVVSRSGIDNSTLCIFFKEQLL
jgi:hypothetical protein